MRHSLPPLNGEFLVSILVGEREGKAGAGEVPACDFGAGGMTPSARHAAMKRRTLARDQPHSRASFDALMLPGSIANSLARAYAASMAAYKTITNEWLA
jgi:hypothetical protein